MVRVKYTLSRGLGPSPQENVSVPLSKHIYSSVLTGSQGLKLKCLGEKLPHHPHPHPSPPVD